MHKLINYSILVRIFERLSSYQVYIRKFIFIDVWIKLLQNSLKQLTLMRIRILNRPQIKFSCILIHMIKLKCLINGANNLESNFRRIFEA